MIDIKIKRGITEIQFLLDKIWELKLDIVICGGYVRYCVSPLANPVLPTDIDIYCCTIESFNQTKEFFNSEKLEIKYESPVALTYKKAWEGNYSYIPSIQLIKPIESKLTKTYGTLEEILSYFDFTVCRVGLVIGKNIVYCIGDEDFEKDEKKKKLVIKNIKCPIATILRCFKYYRRGYSIKPIEIVKLFSDWTDRDENYRNKIVEFFKVLSEGKELTQSEFEELEMMIRID